MCRAVTAGDRLRARGDVAVYVSVRVNHVVVDESPLSRHIYWLLWINKDLDRSRPLNTLLRGKGASPPTIFGTRKVESLSYRMVKKIAEKFNRLSRVHRRHRQQTDNRQTDRQTDGRLIAYSERNVVRSLKTD